MACCSCFSGRTIAQMLILIALGGSIGLADSFIRPAKLTREAPPPPPPAPIVTPLEPRPTPSNANTTPLTTDGGKAVTDTPGTQTPSPNGGTPPKSDGGTPVPPSPVPTPPAPTPTGTPADKLPAGHITIAQAKAFYDAQAAFIDTRKKDVYEAGHVANAYRLELADFKNGDPAILSAIPKDSVIVCYCVGGHCDESEAVARMLDGSGYKKVYVMHDGFPAWKDAGHPVETGEGIQ